ncbi:hypothetical protein ILYODFUR_009063 [Ilyodon furcidens]|uniref:Uncharacterized protein n=1 Tax=Ilyodon furcidens TaxID=33524 RepID=A0ABV0V2M9_9TELE
MFKDKMIYVLTEFPFFIRGNIFSRKYNSNKEGKLHKELEYFSSLAGMTLWGRDDLANHVVEKPQFYNDFQIFKSESISQKSSAFRIRISLKASFLFGLVQISGSAKYLHNSKKSRRQARVTLVYEGTTEFQELSIEHLGREKVKYPEVFQREIGTHVVTGTTFK